MIQHVGCLKHVTERLVHFTFNQVGGGVAETVTKGVQFFPAVPRRSRHSSHHFVCTDDTTVSWSEEILFNCGVRGGIQDFWIIRLSVVYSKT